MKIHFCDLCNESVPQVDLDEGQAVLRNGRVVCAQCETAMSGEGIPGAAGTKEGDSPAPTGTAAPIPEGKPAETAAPENPARVQPPGTAPAPAAPIPPAYAPPAPPAPVAVAVPPLSSTGAAVAVVLASVALLLTVGATAFLFDHVEKQTKEQKDAIGRVETRAQMDIEVTKTRAEVKIGEAWDAIDLAKEDLNNVRASLMTSSQEQKNLVDDLREDLVRFATELTSLEEVRVEISGHGQQLNQMSGRSSDLHAQILRLGDRLAEMEAQRIAIAAAPPTPVAEEPSRPAWWPHVGELKSQNSGTRWQAVTALGESGDPATSEYLLPMLKDPDIFVRMATARVLGDLAAPIGIPALIDALEDPEASVREAAVVALRSVTGREHRFDPNAKESERSKAVRRWRDWWQRAEDDFLG